MACGVLLSARLSYLQGAGCLVCSFSAIATGASCRPNLSSQFAFVLENILPTPLGKGRVRYGKRKMPGITLPADAVILEDFPYSQTNGERQAVLYTQVFTRDATVTEAVVVNRSQFSFKTTTPEKYAADTAVEVVYTRTSGIGNLLSSLIVTVNTDEQRVTTITVENNFFLILKISKLRRFATAAAVCMFMIFSFKPRLF